MGGNVWIYALLLIIVVILVNLVLVAMLRGGRPQKQVGMFQRFFQDIRNPYRKEDEMLSELSRRVASLKKEEENIRDKDTGTTKPD
jgi:hypothetical protein